MAARGNDAAIPMVPIPEEGSASLRSLGQPVLPAAAAGGHVTGFTGCLPLLDHCFFVISCCGFVGVLLFLTMNTKFVWVWSLVVIAAVATAAECAECVCRRQQARRPLWDRKVLRFVCGMPFAFFCFYAHSITRQRESCPWYIVVPEMHLLICAKGGVLLAGWVAVFSLALGTLNIDCRASSAVSHNVSNGRWYTACHLLFRASEMMFRLGAAVFLCEGFRVLAASFHVRSLLLCIPFACLVLLYAVFFRCAQGEVESADSPFTCLIVAAFTLALNPMHFVALPGYQEQTLRINKGLFVIRVGELGLSVCLVYFTIKLPLPQDLCDDGVSGLDVLLLGPMVYQFVASLAVHYLIMALHGEIQHSTCQSLSGEEQGRARARVRVAFPRPERDDLYVPPQPTNSGLCRAWVQLAGGLPLQVASELPPETFDQIYELRSVLGGGTFGVVVRVEKVGDQRMGMAMKLLNTSRPRDRLLAEREVAIYGKIWSRENALEDGLAAVGHPFIVRLYFWSIWGDERKFFLSNEAEEEVRHPENRINKFSVALVMELCDDNLEGYLKKQFGGPSHAWLAIMVRILSMVLLALEFLHRKNMAYRDLKLDNILVSSNACGEVLCKLADFGYGREVDPSAANRPVSVAGSPYFCAPEMEDRVAGNVVEMNQEQENALDTYSYGTVAYALAKGPNFVVRRVALGNRDDHPRCHTRVGTARCQTCAGCRCLANLQQTWAAVEAEGHLVDLIGSCVARTAAVRPAVQNLRGHPLFAGVDFRELLRSHM